MTATTHDYEQLLWEDSTDLADLLDDLSDQDMDAASLCEGWRVRDVVSHMIVGHSTPLPTILATVVRNGFSVPKASLRASVAYGSEHSAEEIRKAWRDIVSSRMKKGIAKTISDKEGFVDHLIHQQDVRRPLDRPREIPAERLVALDAMPTIGGFVKSKQRMAGLRWRATDVGWTAGDGPEVVGSAEAIVLLASGRPAPLGEVTGEGVSTLASRLAS